MGSEKVALKPQRESLTAKINRRKSREILTSLLRDQTFVDYFNVFLNLPVFGQRVLLKLHSKEFIFSPQVDDHIHNRRLLDWLLQKRYCLFRQTRLAHEYQLSCLLKKGNFLLPLQNPGTEEDVTLCLLRNFCCNLIGNTAGMYLFREYLRGTCGARVIACWMHVQAFRKARDPDRRQELFNAIRRLYLQPIIILPDPGCWQDVVAIDLLNFSVLPPAVQKLAPELRAKRHSISRAELDPKSREALFHVQLVLLTALQAYWFPCYVLHVLASQKLDILRKLFKGSVESEVDTSSVMKLIRRCSIFKGSTLQPLPPFSSFSLLSLSSAEGSDGETVYRESRHHRYHMRPSRTSDVYCPEASAQLQQESREGRRRSSTSGSSQMMLLRDEAQRRDSFPQERTTDRLSVDSYASLTDRSHSDVEHRRVRSRVHEYLDSLSQSALCKEDAEQGSESETDNEILAQATNYTSASGSSQEIEGEITPYLQEGEANDTSGSHLPFQNSEKDLTVGSKQSCTRSADKQEKSEEGEDQNISNFALCERSQRKFRPKNSERKCQRPLTASSCFHPYKDILQTFGKGKLRLPYLLVDDIMLSKTNIRNDTVLLRHKSSLAELNSSSETSLHDLLILRPAGGQMGTVVQDSFASIHYIAPKPSELPEPANLRKRTVAPIFSELPQNSNSHSNSNTDAAVTDRSKSSSSPDSSEDGDKNERSWTSSFWLPFGENTVITDHLSSHLSRRENEHGQVATGTSIRNELKRSTRHYITDVGCKSSISSEYSRSRSGSKTWSGYRMPRTTRAENRLTTVGGYLPVTREMPEVQYLAQRSASKKRRNQNEASIRAGQSSIAEPDKAESTMTSSCSEWSDSDASVTETNNNAKVNVRSNPVRPVKLHSVISVSDSSSNETFEAQLETLDSQKAAMKTDMESRRNILPTTTAEGNQTIMSTEKQIDSKEPGRHKPQNVFQEGDVTSLAVLDAAFRHEEVTHLTSLLIHFLFGTRDIAKEDSKTDRRILCLLACDGSAGSPLGKSLTASGQRLHKDYLDFWSAMRRYLQLRDFCHLSDVASPEKGAEMAKLVEQQALHLYRVFLADSGHRARILSDRVKLHILQDLLSKRQSTLINATQDVVSSLLCVPVMRYVLHDLQDFQAAVDLPSKTVWPMSKLAEPRQESDLQRSFNQRRHYSKLWFDDPETEPIGRDDLKEEQGENVEPVEELSEDHRMQAFQFLILISEDIYTSSLCDLRDLTEMIWSQFGSLHLCTSPPTQNPFLRSILPYRRLTPSQIASLRADTTYLEFPSLEEQLLAMLPSFDDILEDEKQREMFRLYLFHHGEKHVEPLDFWNACQEIKETGDRETQQDMLNDVKATYMYGEKRKTLLLSHKYFRSAGKIVQLEMTNLNAVQHEVKEELKKKWFRQYQQDLPIFRDFLAQLQAVGEARELGEIGEADDMEGSQGSVRSAGTWGSSEEETTAMHHLLVPDFTKWKLTDRDDSSRVLAPKRMRSARFILEQSAKKKKDDNEDSSDSTALRKIVEKLEQTKVWGIPLSALFKKPRLESSASQQKVDFMEREGLETDEATVTVLTDWKTHLASKKSPEYSAKTTSQPQEESQDETAKSSRQPSPTHAVKKFSLATDLENESDESEDSAVLTEIATRLGCAGGVLPMTKKGSPTPETADREEKKDEPEPKDLPAAEELKAPEVKAKPSVEKKPSRGSKKSPDLKEEKEAQAKSRVERTKSPKRLTSTSSRRKSMEAKKLKLAEDSPEESVEEDALTQIGARLGLAAGTIPLASKSKKGLEDSSVKDKAVKEGREDTATTSTEVTTRKGSKKTPEVHLQAGIELPKGSRGEISKKQAKPSPSPSASKSRSEHVVEKDEVAEDSQEEKPEPSGSSLITDTASRTAHPADKRPFSTLKKKDLEVLEIVIKARQKDVPTEERKLSEEEEKKPVATEPERKDESPLRKKQAEPAESKSKRSRSESRSVSPRSKSPATGVKEKRSVSGQKEKKTSKSKQADDNELKQSSQARLNKRLNEQTLLPAIRRSGKLDETDSPAHDVDVEGGEDEAQEDWKERKRTSKRGRYSVSLTDDEESSRRQKILFRWSLMANLISAFLRGIRDPIEYKHFENFLKQIDKFRKHRLNKSMERLDRQLNRALDISKLPMDLRFVLEAYRYKLQALDIVFRKKAFALPVEEQQFLDTRAKAILDCFFFSVTQPPVQINVTATEVGKISANFNKSGGTISTFHNAFIRLAPVLINLWTVFSAERMSKLLKQRDQSTSEVDVSKFIGDTPHRDIPSPDYRHCSLRDYKLVYSDHGRRTQSTLRLGQASSTHLLAHDTSATAIAASKQARPTVAGSHLNFALSKGIHLIMPHQTDTEIISPKPDKAEQKKDKKVKEKATVTSGLLESPKTQSRAGGKEKERRKDQMDSMTEEYWGSSTFDVVACRLKDLEMSGSTKFSIGSRSQLLWSASKVLDSSDHEILSSASGHPLGRPEDLSLAAERRSRARSRRLRKLRKRLRFSPPKSPRFPDPKAGLQPDLFPVYPFQEDPRFPSVVELDKAFRDPASLLPSIKSAEGKQGILAPVFDTSFGTVLKRIPKKKSESPTTSSPSLSPEKKVVKGKAAAKGRPVAKEKSAVKEKFDAAVKFQVLSLLSVEEISPARTPKKAGKYKWEKAERKQKPKAKRTPREESLSSSSSPEAERESRKKPRAESQLQEEKPRVADELKGRRRSEKKRLLPGEQRSRSEKKQESSDEQRWGSEKKEESSDEQKEKVKTKKDRKLSPKRKKDAISPDGGRLLSADRKKKASKAQKKQFMMTISLNLTDEENQLTDSQPKPPEETKEALMLKAKEAKKEEKKKLAEERKQHLLALKQKKLELLAEKEEEKRLAEIQKKQKLLAQKKKKKMLAEKQREQMLFEKEKQKVLARMEREKQKKLAKIERQKQLLAEKQKQKKLAEKQKLKKLAEKQKQKQLLAEKKKQKELAKKQKRQQGLEKMSKAAKPREDKVAIKSPKSAKITSPQPAETLPALPKAQRGVTQSEEMPKDATKSQVILPAIVADIKETCAEWVSALVEHLRKMWAPESPSLPREVYSVKDHREALNRLFEEQAGRPEVSALLTLKIDDSEALIRQRWDAVNRMTAFGDVLRPRGARVTTPDIAETYKWRRAKERAQEVQTQALLTEGC